MIMTMQCKTGTPHKTMTEIGLCEAGNEAFACVARLRELLDLTTGSSRDRAAYWLHRHGEREALTSHGYSACCGRPTTWQDAGGGEWVEVCRFCKEEV